MSGASTHAYALDLARSRALAMITDVRDIGPADLHHRMDTWSDTDIQSVLLVLAAMIPDDKPIPDLPGWAEGMVRPRGDADPENPLVDLVAVDRFLRGFGTELTNVEKRAAADLAAGWGWTGTMYAAHTGMNARSADKAITRARRRVRDAVSLAVAS